MTVYLSLLLSVCCFHLSKDIRFAFTSPSSPALLLASVATRLMAEGKERCGSAVCVCVCDERERERGKFTSPAHHQEWNLKSRMD